jgi:hypothetical protein
MEFGKLLRLLLVFAIIVGMFFFGKIWLEVANRKWENQDDNNQSQLQFMPQKLGGGDRIMEARNETAIVLGVRDIYGNEQTGLIVEVAKIRVYYDDGKGRDLIVEDPEFVEWLDFQGKTQIAMPEGSYQVTFNFEWGPLKWNAFDVYFTTDLDPGTVCKIQFAPAKP